MIGFELVKDLKTKEPASAEAKELIKRGGKLGVLMITGGISTVRMAPPLIISTELVDKGLEIFEPTARDVAQEKLKNNKFFLGLVEIFPQSRRQEFIT